MNFSEDVSSCFWYTTLQIQKIFYILMLDIVLPFFRPRLVAQLSHNVFKRHLRKHIESQLCRLMTQGPIHLFLLLHRLRHVDPVQRRAAGCKRAPAAKSASLDAAGPSQPCAINFGQVYRYDIGRHRMQDVGDIIDEGAFALSTCTSTRTISCSKRNPTSDTPFSFLPHCTVQRGH